MYAILEHDVGWLAASSVLMGAMDVGANSEAAASRPTWWEPTHRRLLQSRTEVPAVSSGDPSASNCRRPWTAPTESRGCPSLSSLVHRRPMVDGSGGDYARWTQLVEGRPVQVPTKHYRNDVCKCDLWGPCLSCDYGCVTSSWGMLEPNRFFTKSVWLFCVAEAHDRDVILFHLCISIVV